MAGACWSPLPSWRRARCAAAALQPGRRWSGGMPVSQPRRVGGEAPAWGATGQLPVRGRMRAQGGEEGCPSAWAGGLASRRRGVAWSAWRVIFAIPKSHQLAVGLDFSPYPNPISWWWVGPSTGHQWPGRGPLGGVAAVEVER